MDCYDAIAEIVQGATINVLLNAIKSGSDPNDLYTVNQENGQSYATSALMFASEALNYCKFVDVAEFLFDNGANIDLQDDNGDSVLHFVAKKGYRDIFHYLVAKGGRTDLVNKKGLTPYDEFGKVKRTTVFYDFFDGIREYGESGNAEKYNMALEQKADPNAVFDILDDNGNYSYSLTALECAVLELEDEDFDYIVENFLNIGADINLQNKEGNTALHIALQNNQKYKANSLIMKGANKTIKNNAGKTPDMTDNNRSVANIPTIDCYDAILEIQKGATLGFLETSLKQGNNPNRVFNIRDNNNQYLYSTTALALAVKKLNSQTFEQVLKLMLKYNLDINGQDKEGDTALHVACRELDREKAMILIDNGADENIRNNKGFSPSDDLGKALVREQKNEERKEKQGVWGSFIGGFVGGYLGLDDQSIEALGNLGNWLGRKL